MHLPRRLRQMADLDEPDDLDEDPDAETFQALLLAALTENPEVRAAVRRLAAPAKPLPEPRSARRR